MQFPWRVTKLIVAIVAFTLANLIGDFAAAQEKNDIAGEAAGTTPESVAVEGISEDSKIARRLQEIYRSSGWFDEVDVAVSNGFVTIQGMAQADEHSKWAEAIATRTTDVIGVDNQLQVDSNVDFAGAMSVVGNSLGELYRDFLLRLPFIATGLLVIFVTWLVSKFLVSMLRGVLDRQNRLRRNLRDLLLQLASISTWIVGLMIATIVVFPGMTPARALTVLGLGSVAIGFAFKDIFENFFAGVLILWRYPIDVGDFIQHGTVTGKVEEITIRNTLLRRGDGELVIIPNGQLFKSNVEVLTNQSRRRIRIDCGVGYGEDLATARNVIRKAVQSCQSVDSSRDVQVFAKKLADSSVDFEIGWWAASRPVDIQTSRDEVIEAVKAGLDNHEIEIPYPHCAVVMSHPLPALMINEGPNGMQKEAAKLPSGGV